MLLFKEFGGLFPALPLLGLRSRLGKGAKRDSAQAAPPPTPAPLPGPELGSSKLWKDFEWATPSSNKCAFL